MNTINIGNEQRFSSSSDLSPATGLTPSGTANNHELERGIFAKPTNKPSGTSAESSEEVSKWSKPFNHLPDELVNEIFLHCASSPIEICGDPPCTLWSLAQVSQRWRTIALSESNLWTCITADLDVLPRAVVQSNQRTHALLNFFRGCLHRSRDRPLYLRVKAYRRLPPLLFPLTDLCLAEAHRWQTVSLHFSVISKLRQSQGQLSLLKALSLNWLEYRPAFPINAFIASPQLTHLTLCKLHRPLGSLILPWNQITHFESIVLRYGAGELDKILMSMPLLEELKMVCGMLLFPMSDHNATIKPISLPHLRSLHVSGCEEALDQILISLHTPSLKHFALKITNHSSSHGTPSPDLVVSAFLVLHLRSMFTLDSLSIDGLPVQSIARILDHVPSITRLFVRSPGGIELFPTYLTLNRDTTTSRPFYHEWGPLSSFFLVPNLRDLVMEDTYTYTDSATLTSSAGALLKMVKSRLDPQADSEGRLESVSVVVLLGVGLFDFDTSAFYGFGEAQGVKMNVDVRRKGLHQLSGIVPRDEDNYLYPERQDGH
ncbi:uncharacterized protein LACBIDRAFT_313105 [Laccaria bicolor S238N-H82]|uniref:Predicted protein n=1 Tax=Laccaria bicolor (strain S238N-H82 / ATCC MYA-4686) TaxID=486041 RepID=B0DXJ6_LACBS|nr:uncharacterized protein LACBIDRAFT_313105 [Laccaria bicolor S238N-H82]EDR00631.1 predicted protein [Laccaria bicolor S238N-H82]|eukprot:XP_001888640.1 predicted protein [Laccaria bicolor S238N-H82]